MTDSPPTPVEIAQDEREGHASASGMFMLASCPGCLQAQEGLPELPETDKTKDDGTAIHDALHTGDDSDLEFTQREIAQKLKVMEMAALAEWCEYQGSNIAGNLQVIRETRFWVRNPQTLELVASAKPDVVFIYGFTCALVIDFKSGFADQTPAERNWQLHTQALAIKQEHRVHDIRAAIAHSRLSSKFDSVDYSAEDLKRIERDIVQMAWKAKQPFAPRVPGAWCRYCRANGVCREKAVFDHIASAQLPIVSGKPDQLAVLDAVNRLTPPEMAFLFQRKASMTFAYEAIEARLKSLPAEVLQSVGYELRPGNHLKDIVNVAVAFSRLAPLLNYTDAQGLEHDDRMEIIKITRGKAAELLADRTGIPLKAAKEQVDEALGDAIVGREGKPKLGPIR